MDFDKWADQYSAPSVDEFFERLLAYRYDPIDDLEVLWNLPAYGEEA